MCVIGKYFCCWNIQNIYCSPTYVRDVCVDHTHVHHTTFTIVSHSMVDISCSPFEAVRLGYFYPLPQT